MDDYARMYIQKRKNDEEAKLKYKRSSKERLSKIITKKITTTMIGALETIEKSFGFLWEESPEMRELYEKTRKEILDKGNAQARNMSTELEQYDVEWLRYTMILPVKPLGTPGGNIYEQKQD